MEPPRPWPASAWPGWPSARRPATTPLAEVGGQSVDGDQQLGLQPWRHGTGSGSASHAEQQMRLGTGSDGGSNFGGAAAAARLPIAKRLTSAAKRILRALHIGPSFQEVTQILAWRRAGMQYQIESASP